MIDRKYWQTALDVQSACNLSGVLFSFEQAMRAVCDEARELNEGTEWKNKHPIVVLFVTQLAHLSGVAAIAEINTYNKAYEACVEGAEKWCK